EEEAADDGVAAADEVGDPDLDVSAQVPHQVLARGEARDGAAVQHGAGAGVEDLDALLAPAQVGVPVQEVQADLVLRGVGQVDVDGEAGSRVVGGGDAVGGVRRLLQVPGLGAGGVPHVGAGAADRHLGVGRVLRGVAHHTVAVRPVDPAPAPL